MAENKDAGHQNQEGGQKEHVRRARYKGVYPKKYEEKYKELNPDKYADTLAHVKDKGITPAGTHIPIMVNEILDVLQIRPGMTGMDATLGYGGHTSRMLEKLEHRGHIYATDVDPIESVKTKERLAKLGYGEEILSIRLMNFAQIDELVKESGLFDFILADLGVSSMQIDNPERGFSYKTDGLLDLRMNPQQGMSAAERLAEMDEEEITGMLIDNADEPYAQEIARQLCQDRKRGRKIETTTQLREEVEKVLLRVKGIKPEERAEVMKKSCARVFQALRIDVNQEYEVLYAFLEKLPGALKPGGRVAVLTFHSGEDRLVKKSFRELYQRGVYSEIAQEVTRPSPQECVQNSRARSTKLRWAIKS